MLRDQAGRPRQGHGDLEFHAGGAVCGAAAGVRRRRSHRRVRLRRGDGRGRVRGQGRPRPRRMRTTAAGRRRRAPLARGSRACRNPWTGATTNAGTSISPDRQLHHRRAGRSARRDRLGLLSALRRRRDVLRAAGRRERREERGIYAVEIWMRGAPSSTIARTPRSW